MNTQTPAAAKRLPPFFTVPFFGFNMLDALFAVWYVALGRLYWELCPYWAGRTLGGAWLFAVLYALTVLAWAHLEGHDVCARPESWFWLGVTLALCGAASSGTGLVEPFFAFLAAQAAAAYWTLSVTGRLAKRDTSNWLFFDGLNALCIVPFGNFVRLPAALVRAVQHYAGGGRRAAKRAGAVLGGVLLALVVLMIAVPLLAAADDRFAGQVLAFTLAVRDLWSSEELWWWAFSLPVMLFLYGLTFGAVHGRRTKCISRREVCELQRSVRVLPRATVVTAAAVLCAVYALFLALQAGTFLESLAGRLPEGFTYAEYARQGFFELCRVAAVNLCALAGLIACSRERIRTSRALRAAHGALCAATLLLIAVAMTKMGLYMSAFGLTPKRVLVTVFLVWLALVFALIWAALRRELPVVRISVLTGAVLFTLLCALPVPAWIDAFNTAFFPAA